MNARVDVLSTGRMATDIIVAYLGTRTVEPDELPALVRKVHAALTPGVAQDEAVLEEAYEAAAVEAAVGARAEAAAVAEISEPAPQPQPAAMASEPAASSAWMSPQGTIHPDYIICLEDGRKFQTLRRHLGSKYNLTPEQYRLKWNLPDDYPMVAENYAKKRSAIAREIGLGRKDAPEPKPAKRQKR